MDGQRARSSVKAELFWHVGRWAEGRREVGFTASQNWTTMVLA